MQSTIPPLQKQIPAKDIAKNAIPFPRITAATPPPPGITAMTPFSEITAATPSRNRFEPPQITASTPFYSRNRARIPTAPG
ncbi:hypothetical protein NL676_014251 [Syzygium grande]|nr:hypothetical protein NL676_014251 [Syzygium grande]